MSAPSLAVRRAVYHRDVERCVACNAADELTFQHRRRVGMGGSKNLPSPVDGLTLCMSCNAACEGRIQTLALAYGWKVRAWADPTLVPVYYPHEFTWCRLEGVKRVPITTKVALALMASVYGNQYLEWRAD